MLILNKETIARIIENDNAFDKDGRFRHDFLDDMMSMCYEYTFLRKLRTTLAFSESECNFSLKKMTITITVVVKDAVHLLVKEMRVDEDGETIEFWLLNRNSLIGDVVWEYLG